MPSNLFTGLGAACSVEIGNTGRAFTTEGLGWMGWAGRAEGLLLVEGQENEPMLILNTMFVKTARVIWRCRVCGYQVIEVCLVNTDLYTSHS